MTSSIKNITLTSMYATLIFLSIQVFRIPVGPQFIHFGNALVVVGVLVLGFKRGTLAALIGLATFDLLNGYAAEIWIISIEAIIVCLIVSSMFHLFKQQDTIRHITMIAIIAAITKIILNLTKYILIDLIVKNLTLQAATVSALTKILGTFGSAAATIIAVPILYYVLKRIMAGR